ncbi:MAG: BLUF domain-containing protein [Candidatus Competibacteraceae bacterium]|nr:BLUF domain-containing protein [Candidatus Competibacteraceae bacterium]
MTDQSLAHILYISNAIQTPTEADMERLLLAARQNNQRDGITGVLLHHGKIFIQCIEGPRDKLDKLYARIEADPRHKNIIKVLDESIEARSFGTWQMGCSKLSDSEYLGIATADWAKTAAEGISSKNDSLEFRALLGFWNNCVAESKSQPGNG